MYGLNRYYGPGCYKFMNDNAKVIYIGKSKNISKRLSSHFRGKKGHLPKEVYDSTAKIEIIKTPDHATALALEQYLINKYKPRYNKIDKEHNINSKVVVNEDYYESIEHWKLYHQFRPYTEDKKVNTTKFGIVMASIYIAAIILITLLK